MPFPFLTSHSSMIKRGYLCVILRGETGGTRAERSVIADIWALAYRRCTSTRMRNAKVFLNPERCFGFSRKWPRVSGNLIGLMSPIAGDQPRRLVRDFLIPALSPIRSNITRSRFSIVYLTINGCTESGSRCNKAAFDKRCHCCRRIQ